MYGTTWGGGAGIGCSASACGTVSKLDTTGKETVLYSFSGYPSPQNGIHPTAGLLWDAGELYGTATAGGGYGALGEVFKLDTAGHESDFYSFMGSTGQDPVSNLIRDQAGNLYGTTNLGGTENRNRRFYGKFAAKLQIIKNLSSNRDVAVSGYNRGLFGEISRS